MKPRIRIHFVATLAVTVTLIAGLYGSVKGQTTKAITSSATPSAKGRIYIFRTVRSSGAHIDDYVTINGVAIQRVTPGNGFYCDLAPGTYLIDLARRKARPLTVPVVAGKTQYVSLMLHHTSRESLRTGALTSDQSFDIRLLDPVFGAQRVQEYHLTAATCQP